MVIKGGAVEWCRGATDSVKGLGATDSVKGLGAKDSVKGLGAAMSAFYIIREW